MQVSFALPDVKKSMQRYYHRLSDACGHVFARNSQVTEVEMLDYFAKDLFRNYVQKYREQLAAWAFAMALRHKLIIPTNDDEETKKVYFLSEFLSARVGRPKGIDFEE